MTKTLRTTIKAEVNTFLSELKKFGREARELSQAGGSELNKAFQAGRLKEELSILTQEREKKLKELGAKVISLIEEGRISEVEFIHLAEEIKKIEAQKKSKEEEIAGLRK